MSKKSRFRGSSNKQYGKRVQDLLKSPSQHFCHIHRALEWKLQSRKTFLLTCKILGKLVNTSAAVEKYPVLKRDNIMIPIQIILSRKQKTFSRFFVAFLKSRLNFKHFKKKDDPHKFFIFEVTDSKNVVR